MHGFDPQGRGEGRGTPREADDPLATAYAYRGGGFGVNRATKREWEKGGKQ